MPSAPRTHRAPAFAAALVLALTGCSGGSTTTSTQTGGGTPATGTSSAAAPAATSSAADPSAPLAIPRLGVSAPVTECPTKDGTVTPPSDIRQVCRWTGGQPFAAETGTTILVGHSTRSKASKGAIEDIRTLSVGDAVTVAGRSWRVAEVLAGVDKRKLPGWVVAKDGPRQLGLITCETTNEVNNDIVRLTPA